MAKGITVPKGVQVSKKTLELLNSSAYLARQKERAERVSQSHVESGYYPEGDLNIKVTGFDVNPQTSRKTQKIYADDWAVRLQICDPTRTDDGKTFTKHYRIFVEDQKRVAEAKKEGKPLFSRDAGELKQLLVAPLGEDEQELVNVEKNWGKILIKLAAESYVLNGRAYTTERTADDDSGKPGQTYRDTHLLVFGVIEEQADPETEDAEEDAEEEEATAVEDAPKSRSKKVKEVEPEDTEEEAEVEDTEEEEEDEETEEEEAEEEEAEEEEEEEEKAVNIEVGSVVTVNHPKRGEIEATVKEIDEEAQTFKASFDADGKRVSATFDLSVITGVQE